MEVDLCDLPVDVAGHETVPGQVGTVFHWFTAAGLMALAFWLSVESLQILSCIGVVVPDKVQSTCWCPWSDVLLRRAYGPCIVWRKMRRDLRGYRKPRET